MESPEPKCPDCGVAMDVGHLSPESVRITGRLLWFRGSPKRGYLGGHVPAGIGQNVLSFSCPKCGLLREYVKPSKWRKFSD